MYYLDNNLRDLKRVFDQNGRSGYLRLDLNENPGGLDEDFVKEVLGKVTPELIAQYPEDEELTKMLASYLGTTPDHLVLTNGSAEAIRYVIQAFTAPGGNIVGVVPSYFMFQVYAQMYGRNFAAVPYTDDLRMPVDNIISLLTDGTQLLILLNPNNPMGNVYSDTEFAEIMSACRKMEISVLIDEAYHYFYPKTFMQYALEERHVFVTRTFSKMFSMAGLRLGYVVGAPEDIEFVRRLTTPHNTNAIAMLFAKELVSRPEMIEEMERRFHEGRNWLICSLDQNGYLHKGEAGNFIFIQPKTDASTVVARMKQEKGILIKSYTGVGELGDCLRVSIGERKFMERFMNALLELDQPVH